MAAQSFLLRVVGIPHIPSITQVNVRSGPGTNHELVFKIDIGTGDLTILQVDIDNESKNLNGKVYQWFRVQFPNGQEGWLRDDLVEVYGDGSQFGYTNVTQPMLAFNLARQAMAAAAASNDTTTVIVTTDPEPDTTPAAQPTPATDQGPAMAMCMGQTGVNVRPGPGTNYNPPLGRMNYLDKANILEARQGDNNDVFKWVKLSYQGREGWAREDFLRYSGGFGRFGIAAEDQYPSPVPQSWWVRDFNLDGSRGVIHHGWDHGGNMGAPVLAGPKGGTVLKESFCQRCGEQGLSAPERGFSLSDSRVLRDPAWNFGYGHYVIIRYTNDLLPESTKQELIRRNFAGGHLFVMYAHLERFLVTAGQIVEPNQMIGTLGNSGNSSGPHLHLEVRATNNPNETQWSRMIGGLMTPQVLFLR